MCMFYSVSCSAKNTTSEMILVGSTPGDDIIKSMLSIPAGTKIDFVKWSLKLDNNKAFVLDINFGESQPNTLGFKNGCEKRTVKGTFTVSKNEGNSNFKEVYHLKSESLPERISLVKLNENVFHLLTPQNQLMIGNGGWSYSLNRNNPVNSGKVLISSAISNQKSLQLSFEGRTPCQEIVAQYPEMNAEQSCFKLKWMLILNRDSVTHQPATCTIRNIVNNEPRNITGKWEIINGTETNRRVVIFKIDVDDLAEPILFLAGDENVLFFLDKNMDPIIGNKDFSFTLNKKM
jgi:hypothetical protein